ncbi:Fic family protein [Vibrio vulnificus]|uniref:Fic family protein n=1 Tax=Vibrio sp. RC586 TaxID=675815 RepID=UPI0001BB854C|nr:Fic family protein [Vibrio sp. RC586]EEY99117.1 hypothetical protein VOA_001466 [Vibrio sp. RC586]EHU9520914.1 Fic family protein [Vibrio vulnificus]
MNKKQIPKTKRQKIAGVEVPPTYSESKDYGEMTFEFARQVDAKKHGFDSKGNYLHWDEFIVRFPEFKDVRVHAWWALKFSRRLVNHANLTYRGAHFSFSEQALLGKLNKIDRLSNLKHLGLDESKRKHYLAGNLIMEEAISSAQLEGATSTRPVAKEMLETGRKPRDFSEKMILNNFRLIQFALESVDQPLSVELIKIFNKVATEEVCENEHTPGFLRQSPIEVADKLTHEVIHRAPDHSLVETMLEELCEYANTEHIDGHFIHPIVKAIVIHFMIGFIHPFLDGNGRTARALFYWYAIKSGYDNFQHISISALLKSKPKKYAKSYVYTETDDLDLTHFIDFNLNVVIEALERFGKYIEDKVNELNKAIEELHKSPYYSSFTLPHMEIIKKSLKDSGRTFTVQEISSDFNVSSPAARSYLNSLSDLGLLIKYNIKGRQKGYIAPSDLRKRLKIDD